MGLKMAAAANGENVSPSIFKACKVGLENCEKIWYVETPNEY